MKPDKWITAALAAALAFALSLGAAGCLVTGFELSLEYPQSLALVCGSAAVLGAAAYSFRHGAAAVLALGAALIFYLWRETEAAEQLLQLLYRISYVYNRGYGWGVLRLVDTSWDAGYADLPLAVLGAALALITARSVCRQKGPFGAVAAGLLPLALCLVVTDTVPEIPYLFALLLAALLLLLTGTVRQNDAFQGSRLTLIAALPTALALGALFLALPYEGYVNQAAQVRERVLDWFQELPESVTTAAQEITLQQSEPESVDLAAMGRRVQSDTVVLSVYADVGGLLYLRGQDYDVYDGFSWSATENRVEEFSCAGTDLGSVTVQTRDTLDHLYLPYYPGGGQRLISGRLDNSRLSTAYTFSRTGLPDDWREQALAGDGVYPAWTADYLTLPESTRAGAEALLEALPDTGASATERAEAIRAYVSACAAYDLNTGRMPSDAADFALWFLEESETGYCVHFATAAVVLLRAAGVPARYVSGYMLRLSAGAEADVTGENAHAWAEYYEPALGTWLILEATPSAASQEEAEPTAAQTAETAYTEAPSAVTEPSQAAETAASAPGETQTPEESAPSDEFQAPAWLVRALKILLGLALAWAALEGQRRVRIRLRRHRQCSGTPNAQALARWQEVTLLARLLGEAPPEVLHALAQKAKFSQHTLSAEELDSFDSFLRGGRRRLKQKRWYWRPIHRYVFAIY